MFTSDLAPETQARQQSSESFVEALLKRSLSSSASGPAADAAAFRPVAVPRVGIAVADAALDEALRVALIARPDLIADDAEADVLIADGAVVAGHFANRPAVLRIGSGGGFDSLEPALILSAAALLAAGYRVNADHQSPPIAPLTARELQVAALLVDGASNKAIARALGISVHTVKFHVAAVLAKLGARNRADAVAIALREGLVTL